MSDNGHIEMVAKIKRARAAGAPIVSINTPDQPALETAIVDAMNGSAPVVVWDFVRGYMARNEKGVEALGPLGNGIARTRENPMGALDLARELPEKTVLIIYCANRYVQDAGVTQALLNLRDTFKGDKRTCILLGVDTKLPAEIATDVISWTEEYPTVDELEKIVTEQVEALADDFNKGKKPDKAAIVKAAHALKSTSKFGAEQLACMSLRKDGIEMDTLNTQAKATIEQTPGLTFERGKETFDDIGGLEFAKQFGKRLFAGPKAPAVIVRVEELEKAMAGAKGDLSGTSGDALQVMLSQFEDNGWSGLLAFGAAGAGKSLFSKSLANTHGAKAVVFDINACKGSLVGQSEANIRRAMQVIHAIGGDRVFFVASCNGLDTLPAALQRRFRSGVWFFDIPDNAERQRIWQICRKQFNIPADDPTPDEENLTGADIRNICEQAYVLACPLAEARKYVVPLKTQSPQDIDQARNLANGRFTDASRGGVYNKDRRDTQAKPGRKVALSN